MAGSKVLPTPSEGRGSSSGADIPSFESAVKCQRRSQLTGIFHLAWRKVITIFSYQSPTTKRRHPIPKKKKVRGKGVRVADIEQRKLALKESGNMDYERRTRSRKGMAKAGSSPAFAERDQQQQLLDGANVDYETVFSKLREDKRSGKKTTMVPSYSHDLRDSPKMRINVNIRPISMKASFGNHPSSFDHKRSGSCDDGLFDF